MTRLCVIMLATVTNLFVKAVQSGTVAQPTQRTFTLIGWNEAFAAIEEPTTADTRLHETGAWAFRKLESIRQRLTETWVELPSKQDSLLAFIGAANRECHLLSTLGLSLEPKSLVMEQVIQAKVDQPHGFGPATPDAMLLASVDALRFPLQRIYTAKKGSVPGSGLQDLEILSRIKLSVMLGQLYSMIEGYWMHALWNGWYVDSKSRTDSDLMLPPEGMRPIVASISEYRREALSLESLQHFSRAWQYRLTEKQRDLLVSKVPEISIADEESGPRFKVSARTRDDNQALLVVLKGLQAERSFYLPLIDERLDKLGTITLHMLLQTWEVLSALAEQLMARLPTVEDSGVYSIEKLLRYAPTISKREVIELVEAWCGFDNHVAERIIDFFSYGSGDKWELWGHPLIKIDNEKLAPLMAPIRYSNLERTFELWMKDSGLRLSDKGHLFENYLRNELVQSLSRSELLKDAEVYPTKVVLRGKDGYEEIDIVIRLQRTILLCEAKCLLFPAEPIEMSRYFDTLEEARSQILRKVEFAKRNLPNLASQLGIADATSLIIEPLILINQPFGAGWPQGDVPVADELIMKRFFEGKWYQLATYNEDELEAHSTLHLYRSEDEASSTIGAYLKNPPQLRHYRQNIKASLQWYPASDKGDRPLATVQLNVVLPLPDINLTVGRAEN